MPQKDGEEFAILKTYCDKLKKSSTLKKLLRARHLNEIREHIRICDYIVEGELEKVILFTAFRYWLECRKHWAKSNPDADVDRVIPNLELKTKPFHKSGPEEKENKITALAIRTTSDKSNKPSKSWEESLSKDDENFLKQLYVGKRPRIPKPNKDG